MSAIWERTTTSVEVDAALYHRPATIASQRQPMHCDQGLRPKHLHYSLLGRLRNAPLPALAASSKDCASRNLFACLQPSSVCRASICRARTGRSPRCWCWQERQRTPAPNIGRQTPILSCSEASATCACGITTLVFQQALPGRMHQKARVDRESTSAQAIPTRTNGILPHVTSLSADLARTYDHSWENPLISRWYATLLASIATSCIAGAQMLKHGSCSDAAETQLISWSILHGPPLLQCKLDSSNNDGQLTPLRSRDTNPIAATSILHDIHPRPRARALDLTQIAARSTRQRMASDSCK